MDHTSEEELVSVIMWISSNAEKIPLFSVVQEEMTAASSMSSPPSTVARGSSRTQLKVPYLMRTGNMSKPRPIPSPTTNTTWTTP